MEDREKKRRKHKKKFERHVEHSGKSNMTYFGVQEAKRKNQGEAIFVKKIVKNFLQIMKSTNGYI